MGTDDLFKKRRAERQKRKHEFKSVNTNSFLIVTEGEKTEPLYCAPKSYGTCQSLPAP